MKKILCFLVGVILVMGVMSGCGKADRTEAEQLISDVQSKINTIFIDASPLYDKGTISSELYLQVTDLNNEFIEIKNLFDTTDGEEDDDIITRLKECSEKADELQAEINKYKDGSNGITANELINITDGLKVYMEDGLEKGYIDNARLEEFNNIVTRLNEIAQSGSEGEEINAELEEMRSTLAVMASQCAAPNDIVDSLTMSENVMTSETTSNVSEISEVTSAENNSDANNNANTGTQTEAVDISALIDNYTLLQNEASRKFEMGEITESNYMTLVQAGTNLAALKEEIDKNGQSESVNKRVEDCRKQIKGIAEGMGSEIADKF